MSHNCKSIVMPLPENIDTGKQNRSIACDECIVPVIEELWKNKVQTLGCCCGHNMMNPSIVVANGYDDDEIREIEEIIKSVDERIWDIFQWRITIVNRKGE